VKSFVFRYQRILKKREDEEEEVKTKLGEANHKLHDLLNEKAHQIALQTQFFQSIEERLTGGIRTSDLQLLGQSKLHFKDKLEHLESQIVEVQLLVIQIKRELTEAVKQRKIMEKLKEKEFEAYTDAVNAAENKVIEEIVNYRSSQKSGDS